MNNKYVKRWRTENNCLPLVFNDIFTPRGNLNLLCYLRSVIFNSLILRSMKWVIHKLYLRIRCVIWRWWLLSVTKAKRNLYDLFTRWELRNLLFLSGMHKSKKVWTCGDISRRITLFFQAHDIPASSPQNVASRFVFLVIFRYLQTILK